MSTFLSWNGMTEEINIHVNGETHVVPDDITVDQMLRGLNLQPAMVVVEHNGDILRRDRYSEVRIAAGDSFELVHFVGGG
jgi:thiamine biosynthesis protein ThiS